jgi:hypothetical protein
LALLATTAILLWIAVAAVIQKPSATGLAIGFLGYTNTSTGTRFALFRITNLDRVPVQRLSPAVELDGIPGLRAPVFNPGLPWLSSTPIAPGASHTIAVGVPLDLGQWRLCLRFQRLTLAERMRDSLIAHRRPVPLALGPITLLGPPQYSSTNSSWITNQF